MRHSLSLLSLLLMMMMMTIIIVARCKSTNAFAKRRNKENKREKNKTNKNLAQNGSSERNGDNGIVARVCTLTNPKRGSQFRMRFV